MTDKKSNNNNILIGIGALIVIVLAWQGGLLTNLLPASLTGGTNLIINGNFDSGTGAPDMWFQNAYPDGTLPDWTNTVSHSAPNSVLFSAPGTTPTTGGRLEYKDDKIAVTSVPYTVSTWVKLDNLVGQEPYIRVNELDANNAFVKFTDFKLGSGTSGWTQKTFTMTPLTSTVRVSMQIVSSNNNGNIAIDDVFFGNGNVISGSPTPAPTTSASVTYGDNIVLNPSFEDGTGAPIHWYGTTKGTTGFLPDWTNTGAHTGQNSLKFTNPGTVDVSGGYYQTKNVLNVSPSTSYKVSVWVKLENMAGTTEPKMGLCEITNDGQTCTKIQDMYLGSGTSNGWVEKSKTFTTQATTYHLYLDLMSSNNHGIIWMDDVSVRGAGVASNAPTAAPTTVVTTQPTTQPTTAPTTVVTTQPTTQPTTVPTTVVTTQPVSLFTRIITFLGNIGALGAVLAIAGLIAILYLRNKKNSK